MRMASSATSNTPMPSTRLGVPVKYLLHEVAGQADGLKQLRAAVAHVGRSRPSCDMIFDKPLPIALM